MTADRAFTSVEICAGAGGQALGVEAAGFGHTALVEYDPDACATLRLNRPKWNVIEADVRGWRHDGSHVDLLAGGCPCPPFSHASKQLGAADERDLIPTFLRLAGEIQPSAVMLENVRGLMDPKFADYRVQALQRLKEYGYVPVMWEVLYAADFGVPQLRPRSVLVALKPEYADRFTPPTPATPSGSQVSVGKALAESMRARGLDGADLNVWQAKANKVAPTLVGGSRKHGGPDLGPTRARKAWAELGVNGSSVANDKEPAALLDDKGRDPRLTVGQCAIVQGFPPEWQFAGDKTGRTSMGKTTRYRQVGNAFPPPVARAVAEQIKTVLAERAL